MDNRNTIFRNRRSDMRADGSASRLAYEEMPEETTDEWVEQASSFSGGGARGSGQMCLMLSMPILLVVGVILMHNWWDDIKRAASKHVIKPIGNTRRLELDGEVEAGARGGVAAAAAAAGTGLGGVQGAAGRSLDESKAVYGVDFGDAAGGGEQGERRA